jgi:hypothetical protein
MTVPTIAIVSYTGLLPINLINLWLPSAQVALSRDFAPHWSDAKLRFAAPGTAIQADEWVLGFFDHSDQAGALGYHDVTPAGLPIMKIFIADCLADRENWNVTSLHEIEETLVDPFLDQTVTVTDGAGITWEYAKEVCDAPEDDHFGRRVNGHLASNAVTPAWFDPNGKPPYTIYPCSEITAPFMLASGGYIGRREIAPTAGEWQQVFARTPGSRQNKSATSRTIRRFSM